MAINTCRLLRWKLKDHIMHSSKPDMLIKRIPFYSKETPTPSYTFLSFSLLIQIVNMGCLTNWLLFF